MSDAAHPQLQLLLAGLHEAPGDDLLWLALADWLEEHGQADRAELTRLDRRLRGMAEGEERLAAERRVQALLNTGARPCVPEVVNSIGMRFALIPAGTFWMGSSEGEAESMKNEEPRHVVEITRPLWMGVHPVTQAQFKAVTGKAPSGHATGGRNMARVRGMDTGGFPVEQVSWTYAVAFCRKLSKLEEENGRLYDLPTEAEWEFCCRAGIFSTPYHTGVELKAEVANFIESGLDRPCPVGSYPPNAWGLHDMHGNVWEWCADRYAGDAYRQEDRRDPRGVAEGCFRVIRGGAFYQRGCFCRSAWREGFLQKAKRNCCGFRICFRMV